MKATGVSRPLDQLGRVVIPKELRVILDIHANDPLAIFTHENQIILRKYTVGCLFCGELDNTMLHFHGEEVCSSCVNEMTEILARGQAAATDQS